MTLSTAINGSANGGGASARTAKVTNGATGVVARIPTGLKAPLTVARDSGSTSITFAASGNQLTASIASALAVGSSLSAIARVTQADGAGVLIPVTLTGVAAAPTLSALTLSTSSATVGTAATINIIGATAGSTITGSVPDGMTLNSGARTITGTPTTAGTYNFSLTETLAGATNTPRVSNVSVVVAASGVQPLRTVANNVFAQGTLAVTATRNKHGFIWTMTIGSGDVTSLVPVLHNCSISSGTVVSPGAVLNVDGMYAVYNGVAVQVTYLGNPTFSVPDGASDFVCDEIAASAFGVSSIPRAATVKLRGVVSRPLGSTANIGTSTTIIPSYNSGDEAFTWQEYLGAMPTNLSATDGSALALPSIALTSATTGGTSTLTCVVAPGGIVPTVGTQINFQGSSTNTGQYNRLQTVATVTGDTFTCTLTAGATPDPTTSTGFSFTSYKVGTTAGYRPMLVGRFVSGNPRTEFFGGDSIDQGLTDQSVAGPLSYGSGYNARSCRDEDTLANPVAYINCAVGGSNILNFIGANQQTWAYMKYCKYGSGKHITNTFIATGTSSTDATTFLGYMREWWAAMKSNGVQQVLAISAPPRVTLAAQSITSIVVASNVATVTTAEAHNLSGTTQVTISGATPSGLNGNKNVTVTGASTFTFTTSGIADQAATGTITYTDNLATYQGQITGPNYDASGAVEAYYAAMSAEIAAGRIDGFIMIDAWRGPSPNQYKWIVNGTNNYASAETAGLHPTGIIHRNAGLELKAKKAAMGWV